MTVILSWADAGRRAPSRQRARAQNEVLICFVVQILITHEKRLWEVTILEATNRNMLAEDEPEDTSAMPYQSSVDECSSVAR